MSYLNLLISQGVSAYWSYENSNTTPDYVRTYNNGGVKNFWTGDVNVPGTGVYTTAQAKWGTKSLVSSNALGGTAGLLPTKRIHFGGQTNSSAISGELGTAVSEFSVEAWIYITGSPSSASSLGGCMGTTASAISQLVVLSNGQLSFRTNNYGNSSTNYHILSSSSNVPFNTWTLVTATYNNVNGQKNVYINGVNVGTATLTNKPTLALNMQVPSSGTGNIFIDGVAIWARANGETGGPSGITLGSDIVTRYNYTDAPSFRTKYWNGTTWASPQAEKYWNGTAWVDWGTTKRWNGTTWITI